MHELAITKSLIELIEAEAKQQKFDRALEITLKIGEFSGIVPECMEEYFPLAAEGTVAEGAKLVFELSRATFRCRDCGYEGEPDRQKACCPVCSGLSMQMLTGKEFLVESLKVE